MTLAIDGRADVQKGRDVLDLAAHAGPRHRWKNGPMPEGDDGRRTRFVEALKRFDAHPRLIKAAQAARGMLPGDKSYGDPLSLGGSEPPALIGQRIADLTNDRPSAVRLSLCADEFSALSDIPRQTSMKRLSMLVTPNPAAAKFFLHFGVVVRQMLP